MNWNEILFFGLIIFFFVVVLLINFRSSTQTEKALENFENPPQPSDIPLQVKAVLDPMLPKGSEDLCQIFDVIRTNMSNNEKTNPNLSPEEISIRVEKSLALSIPGGALPCPLLTYPSNSASDLEWLDFVQKIPTDFGARIIFMTIYAHKSLKETKESLSSSLSSMESFSDICPPDIARSRRNDAKASNCVLPEDMKSEDIKESILQALRTLVAQKNSILQAKQVDPKTDVQTLLTQTKEYLSYIQAKNTQLQNGTLLS